jgi:hypothetical protein
MAVVLPDRPPALVEDRPRLGAQATALEEGTVVVASEKARLLALGPAGRSETGRLCLVPRLLLRLPARLATSSPASAASARVSSLPCSPSGNQSRSRKRGSSRASMYD